ALKYQTERGPVDAVTGNARYTINEAKLLREIVDCSSVDCLVMTLDGCGPFTVRAIACDTISQLKQKILDHIYKRTPHSQRPTLASFDLVIYIEFGSIRVYERYQLIEAQSQLRYEKLLNGPESF
ncbi:hypothetical protein TELCIR_25688, partial [Teladorsagia circumcincta]